MIGITKNQEFLISLLSAAIRNAEASPPKESIDWDELFLSAEAQMVHTLIYPTIDKLPNQYKPAPNKLELWHKMTMVCVFEFAKQAQQLEIISKAFENEKIQVIFLKGAVLRNLYPIPELRTMSDFDILVHKSDKEKVKSIFNNSGYTMKLDYPNTMEFQKKDLIKFEVFFEVFKGIQTNKLFMDNLWRMAVSYKKNMSYVLKFRNEDFLIHLISHLAKHLKNRGAGVRNICDIVLYIEVNSKDIDWGYIAEKINSFGLKKFFDVLIVILHKYFSMQIGAISNISISEIAEDANSADELLQHMLSHGVYGTPFEENLYLPNIKKIHNSRIKMYIECVHQLFPSISKISPRYSYAKKLPILLPFAWIHRLLVIRFERKITIINAIKEMQSSSFEVNTKNRLLRDLGLL